MPFKRVVNGAFGQSISNELYLKMQEQISLCARRGFEEKSSDETSDYKSDDDDLSESDGSKEGEQKEPKSEHNAAPKLPEPSESEESAQVSGEVLQVVETPSGVVGVVDSDMQDPEAQVEEDGPVRKRAKLCSSVSPLDKSPPMEVGLAMGAL